VWRADSKALFYVAADGKLMTVPLKLTATASIGSPQALFDVHIEGGGTIASGLWHQYDVTADGRRILVNRMVQEAPPSPLMVMLNWPAALKK